MQNRVSSSSGLINDPMLLQEWSVWNIITRVKTILVAWEMEYWVTPKLLQSLFSFCSLAALLTEITVSFNCTPLGEIQLNIKKSKKKTKKVCVKDDHVGPSVVNM